MSSSLELSSVYKKTFCAYNKLYGMQFFVHQYMCLFVIIWNFYFYFIVKYFIKNWLQH